ncbi:MAG: prepilin-type N-terminal cleavage/methylation domain-containing protein [Candidatus Omnitrophica bacterium]|nr:prepilin-type N-terminal cleavage/methylation domain-containing protein [Candidatus Omnitrophota bacterium]
MKQGFTLIEMIIVIIIVGVLAAVGMIEYRKVVERSRGAEARMVLGDIRKLAYEYYLENGTTAGITNAHVNIGGSAGQFPSPCRSTHYFQYAMTAPSSTSFESHAWRCTANGKSPQGLPSDSTMCDSCRVL